MCVCVSVCSQISGGEVDKDVLFMTREIAPQVQALVTFRHDPDSVPRTNMAAHKHLHITFYGTSYLLLTSAVTSDACGTHIYMQVKH